MAKFDRLSIFKGIRRISYLVGNFVSYYTPDIIYRAWMNLRFALIGNNAKKAAMQRVDYYVRLKPGAKVDPQHAVLTDRYRFPYKSEHRYTAYFFDLYQSIRLVRGSHPFSYIFGDINVEAPYPAFVKTRPIVKPGEYSDSVLTRLNRLRHFWFIDDQMPWSEKKDALAFRNVVKAQPWRTKFIEVASRIPMCDVGQVNPCPEHPEYVKPYMPMHMMAQYKFVACIEGNDVATNLKWVMSSNSIAVMPKPKIESWFMEARLIGGYHYIEVKDDYSDLEEKLKYYLSHPEEAQAIIDHAHEYTSQFKNPAVEKWVQYNVVKRYILTTSNG